MQFLEANMYRASQRDIDTMRDYPEDRIKKRKKDREKDTSEYGDKLLSEPVYLNVPNLEEFLNRCKQAAKKVPKNAKPFCGLLCSHGIGVVRSPNQQVWEFKKILQNLSPLASTMENGKIIPYDLEQIAMAISFHSNTDNPHSHADALFVDLLTGRIVHLNYGGWVRDSGWKLAFAYGRQELARAQGEDVPRLYKLIANGDGTDRVEIDQEVRKQLAAKNAPSSEAEKKRRKHQPKSPKRKSEAHRGRINPVDSFRALINEHYSDGPPQIERLPPPPPCSEEASQALMLQDRTNPQAIQFKKEFSHFLDEEAKVKQRNNAIRNKLKNLLRQNEMSISATEPGGLMICVRGEHANMSEVDQRWTCEVLTKMLGTPGSNWTIGKPEQFQDTEVRENYPKWLEKHKAPAGGEVINDLPWEDYHIEITRLKGPTLRKDGAFDEQLRTEYELQLDGQLPGEKGHCAAAANLYLRPVMRPGELILAVREIPGEMVDYCRQHYQPALLIKNHDLDFTAVFVLTYDPAQRSEALMTRAALGHELCLELRAATWSDGFLAPGVVQLIGSDYVRPEIVGLPTKEVSAMVQMQMPAVWAHLYQEELKWRLEVNRIEEQRLGLAPGTLNPEVEPYSMPAFEPLRRESGALRPSVDRKAKAAVLDSVPQPIRTLAKKALDRSDGQPKKEAKQEASASPALGPRCSDPEEDRKTKLRRMRQILKLGVLSLRQNHEAIQLCLATEPGLNMELASTGELVLQLAGQRGLTGAFEAFARNGPEPTELLSVWDEAMHTLDEKSKPTPPEHDYAH